MSLILHAMIPARYGSTRLKVKNLCLIAGEPMISYAINAALGSKVFSSVCVNSDHAIFAEIASRMNVEFYRRPNELGSSNTKSDEVIHDYFLSHQDADVLAWVNPISQFQTSQEVSDTVNYFLKEDLDSLITVEEKQVHCSYRGKPVNYQMDEPFAQTQDLQPINPFVYSMMMWRRQSFLESFKKNGHGLFCGKFGVYPVNKLTGLIIKNATDLMMADYMMRALKDSESYELCYDPIMNKYA